MPLSTLCEPHIPPLEKEKGRKRAGKERGKREREKKRRTISTVPIYQRVPLEVQYLRKKGEKQASLNGLYLRAVSPRQSTTTKAPLSLAREET